MTSEAIEECGMLKIRRGNGENLGIISHISPEKHICDPSLELSR